MLTRDACDRIETQLLHEVSNRAKLGGYSPDSGTLLLLCQTCFELIRHIREKMPSPKSKKTDE